MNILNSLIALPTVNYKYKMEAARIGLCLCIGVTESRDVDCHVSGTPLPTYQQPSV